MDLAVPYEDEHLLIVDKPAGLVVHPAPGHAQGTLVHGLLAYDVEGGDEPIAPASCTGSIATPRACSSSRARPRRTGACRSSCAFVR